MNHTRPLGHILGIAMFLAATTATAQEVDPATTVVLMPYPYAAVSCGTFEETDALECTSIAGEVGPVSIVQVYVLLVREGGFPNGVGGLEFGIQYDETVGPVHWSHCAGGSDISEEGWPASGTGNAMTWAAGCHLPPGEVTIAGVIEITNPNVGDMRIIPDPRTGRAEWVDCDLNLFEICPENLGTLDLATAITPLCGDHCGSVPTSVISWGRIKSVYRN